MSVPEEPAPNRHDDTPAADRSPGSDLFPAPGREEDESGAAFLPDSFPAAEASDDHTRGLHEPPTAAPRPAQRLIHPVKPGDRLGSYEILRLIGKGGMGLVYEAMDTVMERKVAIKLLPSTLPVGSVLEQRLLQEARTAGRILNPHTVTIFETERLGDRFYLVMEYVDGGSLGDRLAQKGKIPWREATQLIADACQGLQAVHEAGMIHRDIKPANLLVNLEGKIKLTDFGLAKIMAELDPELTAEGRIVGSPQFMSPEQCDDKPLDPRTDIYSMGATYYALVTGKGPYAAAESASQIMMSHCLMPPPDPRQVDPSLPEDVARIIQRAMAKRPSARYPSATALREDLEDLLAGKPLSQETPRLTGQGPREDTIDPTVIDKALREEIPSDAGNRRKWLMAGAGAAGLLAMGAALAYWKPWAARTPGRRGTAPQTGKTPRPGPAASSAVSGRPVKIGALISQTGSYAVTERTILEGITFAVEQLNQAGGVLGQPLEIVLGDGASNPEIYANEAARLIEREGVAVLIGGGVSACRKMIMPVVEQANHLLVYPHGYEGLESSPCIAYMGATPNQFILPMALWGCTQLGSHPFLVGNHGVFSHVAHAIIRDEQERLRCTRIDEAFIRRDGADVAPVINQIRDLKPNYIITTLSGESNLRFYQALRLETKIASSALPAIGCGITEFEIQRIGATLMVGDYAVWNYFQSIDTQANHQFRALFKNRFGADRVTTDPIESAYISILLWGRAVEAAGTTDAPAVRNALHGLTLDAPEGPVRIDRASLQTWRRTRLGRIRSDGQFDLPIETELKEPLIYPSSRRPEEWNAFLQGLYRKWGNRWEALDSG